MRCLYASEGNFSLILVVQKIALLLVYAPVRRARRIFYFCFLYVGGRDERPRKSVVVDAPILIRGIQVSPPNAQKKPPSPSPSCLTKSVFFSSLSPAHKRKKKKKREEDYALQSTEINDDIAKKRTKLAKKERVKTENHLFFSTKPLFAAWRIILLLVPQREILWWWCEHRYNLLLTFAECLERTHAFSPLLASWPAEKATFLPQSISWATPRFPGFFFDVNFLYCGGVGKGGFVGSQRRRMRKKKKILISIGKGFGGGGTSKELPKVERGRKKEREW